MPTPAAVAGAATARSKTGQRVIAAAVALSALGLLLVFAPLATIPLALAGQGVPPASAAAPIGGGPAVVGTWAYPLAGDYSKGRGFGWHPIDGCSYCSSDHEGYDMAQECGATIYAAGPGTVVIASAYQGYGNAVLLDHGDGLITIYGHMQWGSLRVGEGQVITAGTPLGAEGNTGNSFGCHLHFEIRINDTPIDAEPFMAARGLPLK